jgi:CRP-like cAMP-binding protein
LYGPGAYFPVITAFFDRPQRAYYEALTGVVVDEYSHQEFTTLIEQDPTFTKEILRKTVSQLAIFASRVIELQTTKLDDRVLMKLTLLAKQHATGLHGEIVMPYSLKHHHIADMLGVERESISRSLNRLKRKGLLKTDRQGQLVIVITE